MLNAHAFMCSSLSRKMLNVKVGLGSCSIQVSSWIRAFKLIQFHSFGVSLEIGARRELTNPGSTVIIRLIASKSTANYLQGGSCILNFFCNRSATRGAVHLYGLFRGPALSCIFSAANGSR